MIKLEDVISAESQYLGKVIITLKNYRRIELTDSQYYELLEKGQVNV